MVHHTFNPRFPFVLERYDPARPGWVFVSKHQTWVKAVDRRDREFDLRLRDQHGDMTGLRFRVRSLLNGKIYYQDVD